MPKYEYYSIYISFTFINLLLPKVSSLSMYSFHILFPNFYLHITQTLILITSHSFFILPTNQFHNSTQFVLQHFFTQQKNKPNLIEISKHQHISILYSINFHSIPANLTTLPIKL